MNSSMNFTVNSTSNYYGNSTRDSLGIRSVNPSKITSTVFSINYSGISFEILPRSAGIPPGFPSGFFQGFFRNSSCVSVEDSLRDFIAIFYTDSRFFSVISTGINPIVIPSRIFPGIQKYNVDSIEIF